MLPDVITYVAAISACEKAQDWCQALGLWLPSVAAICMRSVAAHGCRSAGPPGQHFGRPLWQRHFVELTCCCPALELPPPCFSNLHRFSALVHRLGGLDFWWRLGAPLGRLH